MVKKLLWVLTVLSDWLKFFVEDIFVESLTVSPEIVEEDLAATDVGDLVDWTRVQALDCIFVHSWPVKSVS
jgi:hypothetical protein